MTGMPDFNFPAFNAEAERLRGIGYEVINPAELNPDTTMGWHECMRRDLVALLECDVIALLAGWPRSSGAHLEMHVAHRVGIEIAVAADLPPIGKLCPNCDTPLPGGCEGVFAGQEGCPLTRIEVSK
jgi:hypothetical protein